MTLEGELERCRPWLERSSHVDLDDLRSRLASGQAQLWPGPDAVVVTEVSLDDEAGAVLTLWIVGGRLRTAQVMLPLIEAQMKAAGCAEVRFAPARPGWERVGRAWGFREIKPGVWARRL